MSTPKNVIVVGTSAPLFWLIAIIIFVLLIVVGILGLVIVPRLQVKQHYQAGVAFQNVGDFENAIQDFEQVIRIDSKYGDVTERLKSVKGSVTQSFETATANAKAASEKAQIDTQATLLAGGTATAIGLDTHYQKGVALMNLGRWQEAKAEFEQVLQINPSYKDIQEKLLEVEKELIPVVSSATPTSTPIPISTYNWLKINPSQSPPPRGNYGLVFDSQRKVFVLFGGTTGTNMLGDTWKRDGVNWEKVSPQNSPSPRFSLVMVYDTLRSVIILFGGKETAIGHLNDTWEYDGLSWKKIELDYSPPPMRESCAAYDEKNGVVVLFGGWDEKNTFGDTWVYDGNKWIKQELSQSPPARRACAMAYNPTNSTILMFGGDTFNGTLNDTWEWNGRGWSERSSSIQPPKRAGHALVYHPLLNKTLLFGGDLGACTTLYKDTWAWDGNTWQELSISKLGTHSVINSAYDPYRNVVLMYGGWSGGNSYCKVISETWEFTPIP